MGSDPTSRTLVLLILLGLLAGFLWLVREILPPFLIALALALLLDPLLDRMQRWGLPRWAAVTLTFGAFLALFFGAIAFAVPALAAQVSDLIENLPTYTGRIEAAVDGWAERNASLLRSLNLPPTLGDLWDQNGREIGGYLQMALQQVFAALRSSAAMLGWMVVVPIVTLYLLADVDALQARLRHLIPEERREVVGAVGGQVARVFAAYVRGLTLICASFGLAVYLVLAAGFRLPYALILGILAAVLYAVPYLGQLALLILCAVVALATGHAPAYVAGVTLAVLAVGQVFDQLITPRVIGRQVGLHPVLGLFALMAGGHLFGLAGMVLAVPVAASVRVVLIHLFPRLAEPIPDYKPGPG